MKIYLHPLNSFGVTTEIEINKPYKIVMKDTRVIYGTVIEKLKEVIYISDPKFTKTRKIQLTRIESMKELET